MSGRRRRWLGCMRQKVLKSEVMKCDIDDCESQVLGVDASIS